MPIRSPRYLPAARRQWSGRPSGLQCDARVRLARSWPYSLLVPADEIEKREQEDPDDVDKVPVQAEVLDKRYVAGCVGIVPGAVDHVAQNRDADDHVQRVHAGHGEVQEEVE